MDTKGPPVEVDEMPLEALDLEASDRAMNRTAKWWEGRPQEQKDKELEDLKMRARGRRNNGGPRFSGSIQRASGSGCDRACEGPWAQKNPAAAWEGGGG